MTPGVRIAPGEFLALDLEVHAFLGDVPLRDVSAVDLPGGGPARTLADVRALLSGGTFSRAGPAVRGLFALRRAVGTAFGWDRADRAPPGASYADRLTDDQRARSEIPAGTAEGPFRVLYAFPHETLAEARNATVHAFSCMALAPRVSGYRFYWAVYVLPVSRWTPLYMAAIEPFRRFVVYPRLLDRLRREWTLARAADGAAGAGGGFC